MFKDANRRGPHKHRAAPERVDFRDNGKCRRVAELGNAGLKSAVIAEATGYTVCQVRHRLKRANIHLNDYRNGSGALAQAVLKPGGVALARVDLALETARALQKQGLMRRIYKERRSLCGTNH